MSNKYLFVVLLIANVFVFIWEAASRAPAKEDTATDATATLQLLSEQANVRPSEKSQQTDKNPAHDAVTFAASPTAIPTGNPNYNLCLQVGPFDGKAHATAAERWFSRRRAQVWLRSEPPLNGVDYFVYLPRMDEQASAAAIDDSHNKGLDHVITVQDERGELRVSFGKFSTEAQARARLRQIGRLGIQAQLHAAARTGPTYWLDVASERGQELLVESKARFRDQAIPKEVKCSKVAALTDR